jgi:hypothetical protein
MFRPAACLEMKNGGVETIFINVRNRTEKDRH